MDIFQLLEEARPTEPPPAEHLAAVREQLLTVTARPPVPKARRVRRHRLRWVAALVAAALAAGGGIAWATTHQTPRTPQNAIACGSLNSFIGSQTGNPVADCRTALDRLEPTVPPLTGWVLPSGEIAVLPTTEAPPSGSTPLPSDFSQNRAVLFVTEMLMDIQSPVTTTCTTTDQAAAYVRWVLGTAGLTGWSVVVTADPAASCNVYGGNAPTVKVDTTTETVTLYGRPLQKSPSRTTWPVEKLARMIHGQLSTTEGPSCLSLSAASALLEQDAAEIGIPSNTRLSVSQAGTIGTMTSTCAVATFLPSPSNPVDLWAVPAPSAVQSGAGA